MSEKTELKPFPKSMALMFKHPVLWGWIIGLLLGLIPGLLYAIVMYLVYTNIWFKKYKDHPSHEDLVKHCLNAGIAAVVVFIIRIFLINV